MVSEQFFVDKPKIPQMSVEGDESEKEENTLLDEKEFIVQETESTSDVPLSYPSFLSDNLSELSEEDLASRVAEINEIEPDLSNNMFAEELGIAKPMIPTQPVVQSDFSSENEEQKEVRLEQEEIIATAEPELSEKPQDEIQEQDTVLEKVEETVVQPVEDEEISAEEEESSIAETDYKSATFLDDLFANGNECITSPNGSFPVKDDTRTLLALFSNGRFFVAESARFDGKVLGFEYLARRRRMQIGKPEYVPTIVINDIYE
jgi:hypothetical protein